MSSVPVKRINRFLESCLERVSSVNSDLDLVLYTVNVTGRKAEVWNNDKNWKVDEATAQIAENAQAQADGNQGTTKFALVAYEAGNGRQKVLTMLTFAISAEDMGEDDTTMSEPANMQGFLAQLMRHTNDLHRQTAGMWGIQNGYFVRIIERLSEQNEKLQTEKAQAGESMEALMSRKHERDVQMKTLEADQKRKDEFWGKLLQLFPVAINKLAGKEIVRQNDTLFEITATEFMSTLTPDKLDAYLQSGLLDKHQLALLVTMLEQISKRMVTAEEKKDSGKAATQSIFGSLGKLITTGGV